MKRITMVFAITLLVAALGAIPVFAQSSGNFNYTTDTGVCANTTTGIGGTGHITDFMTDVNISTSGGNGNALIVRPSAVVGLFTDTKLTASGTACAQVGVTATVTIAAVSGGGCTPTVIPSGEVTYENRIQQISSTIFGGLGTCSNLASGPCATAANVCCLDFLLSTLSAHSYDFVIKDLCSGDWKITVSWDVNDGAPACGAFSGGGLPSVGCVGPINLTVTQVKLFEKSVS